MFLASGKLLGLFCGSYRHCAPLLARLLALRHYPGMAKRLSKKQPRTHFWAIYHGAGVPEELVGFVDAPDEQSAIVLAIEKYDVPPEKRSLLLALRRD